VITIKNIKTLQKLNHESTYRLIIIELLLSTHSVIKLLLKGLSVSLKLIALEITIGILQLFVGIYHFICGYDFIE